MWFSLNLFNTTKLILTIAVADALEGNQCLLTRISQLVGFLLFVLGALVFLMVGNIAVSSTYYSSLCKLRVVLNLV